MSVLKLPGLGCSLSFSMLFLWLWQGSGFIRSNGGMSHGIPGIQVRATLSNETMLAEKLSLSASAQSKRWS